MTLAGGAAPTAPATVLLLVLASTLAFASAARAADWVERPFDPPAGSRWIIQSDETTEDNRDGHLQTSVMKMTSELTIDEKIANGSLGLFRRNVRQVTRRRLERTRIIEGMTA